MLKKLQNLEEVSFYFIRNKENPPSVSYVPENMTKEIMDAFEAEKSGIFQYVLSQGTKGIKKITLVANKGFSCDAIKKVSEAFARVADCSSKRRVEMPLVAASILVCREKNTKARELANNEPVLEVPDEEVDPESEPKLELARKELRLILKEYNIGLLEERRLR